MARHLSLAEQIAQLDDAAPVDIDIERVEGGLEEDEGNTDLTAGRGHYLDVGTSSLRKQQDALVDPKYAGVRTSRMSLQEFSDISGEEELGGGAGSDSASEPGGDHYNFRASIQLMNLDESSLDEEPSTLADEEEENDDAEGDSDSSEDEIPAEAHEEPGSTIDNLAATLKRTREADKDKGRAILQQRSLWSSLLETRIRLQKAATASNRLPHPNDLGPYVTSETGQAAVQSLVKEMLAFSDELLTLRKRLIEVNEPDVELPTAKRQRQDTNTDLEQHVQQSTLTMVEVDAAYHPSCVRTLQKWSNKIAAVTPSSLSSKSFRGAGTTRSTVELVEEALGESGAKAVGRTRVRRSAGARISAQPTQVDEELLSMKGGGTDGTEGDAEIFDDLDFYQALLRDVIDSRTGAEGKSTVPQDEINTKCAAGLDDWASRQRMKKAKKVVDTKASKGRKLRYEVHEKLQNFMVPVPTATWHEEQIDELFANLLGRDIERGELSVA